MYNNTNPSRIKGKRKVCNKTLEIAGLIDESLGKIVVISPNLGVSKKQIKIFFIPGKRM